jgi:hypothetical protein
MSELPFYFLFSYDLLVTSLLFTGKEDLEASMPDCYISTKGADVSFFILCWEIA